MANYTTNYNLEMPEQNDFYNVDVQNENMKKIDQAIKEAGNNEALEGNVAGLVEKIGTTTDVGGSNTAGSTMAKLNALLKTLGNSNTSLAELILSLSNRGVVKSVQRGSYDNTSGSSRYYDITISKVNPSKSMLILYAGNETSGASGTRLAPRGYISSTGTSVRVYYTRERQDTGDYSWIREFNEYYWEVVEFY